MFHFQPTSQNNAPHIPADIVIPQNLKSLLAQLSAYSVTLVTAPSGYGKTCVIAEWFRINDIRAHWVTITPQNAHMLEFDTTFSFPKYGHAIDVDGAEISVTAQSIASSTHGKAIHSNEQYYLVIDNTHLIESTIIWGQIATLLKAIPRHGHILLLGQRQPACDVTSLVVNGQVLDLQCHTFTFNKNDVETLGSRFGTEIHDATAILKTTEGWALGVRLLLRTKPDTPPELSAQKVIARFFHTIFENMPDWVQQLIPICAQLPRFCPELLSAIAPECPALAFIQYLTERQLFIFGSSTHREWYRMHPMLAGNFEATVQTVQLQRICTAAEWFIAQGFLTEGLEVYQRTKHHAQIIEVLRARAADILRAGNTQLLVKYCAELPHDILRTEPELCVMYGWALLIHGDYDRCAQVEACVFQTPHTVLDEHETLVTVLACYRTGVVHPQIFTQPIFSRLFTKYPFFAGLVHFVFNITQVTTEISEIRQPTNELYRFAHSALRTGEYTKLLVVMHESLHNSPTEPAHAVLYCMWAEAALAMNQWSLASELIENAAVAAEFLGHWYLSLYICTLKLKFLRGTLRSHEANAIWNALYHETSSRQMIPLGRVVIWQELWKHALYMRDQAQAEYIRQHISVIIEHITLPAENRAKLALLDAYATWMWSDTIQVSVVTLTHECHTRGWTETFVGAALLLITADAQQYEAIEKVLADMNPRHTMPGILNEWQALLAAQTRLPKQTSSVIDRLTARELDVFRAAASGLTTAEIAAKLYISLATAKTHLLHIYEKTGVSRRTALIQLAAELEKDQSELSTISQPNG